VVAITLDRADKDGLQDGFLYIAEQIPGQVKVNDVTPIVRKQGYWSSYNIPFDEEIYNRSGYPAQVEKMGPENSYDNCSRANIFRRDAPGARVSLEALKGVLGSNNFQTDPLSLGDPTKAISARGDLDPDKPDLYGGVDMKVTEVALSGASSRGWEGTAWARSGPTTNTQEPFSWLTVPNSEAVIHLGQPAVFDFPFVTMAFSDASGEAPVRPRPALVEALAARAADGAPLLLGLLALFSLLMVLGGLLRARARLPYRSEEDQTQYYLQA